MDSAPEFAVRRYRASDEADWNAFLSKTRNRNFIFHRSYMDYHSDRFVDHSLIFTRRDRIFALLPANEAASRLLSHGGLSFGGLLVTTAARQTHVANMVGLIKQYGLSNRLTGMTYRPQPQCYHSVPAEDDIVALFGQGASVCKISASSLIKLPPSVPATSSRSLEIRRAREHGVLVTDDSDYEGFIHLCEQSLAERYDTKPVHTAAELRLLSFRFPYNIALLAARHKGELLAGIVLYINATCVRAQYLASTDEGRRLGAVTMLKHAVVERASAAHSWFDLGTSTRPISGTLNEALAFSKESYGARSVAQYSFDLIF